MYQISIVTPFHNVAMDLFRRSYESLMAQTLGFQNIQWIVVLHNKEPQYQEAVHALLREHDNVIIRSLDNDVHTPSSPRNHGYSLPCSLQPQTIPEELQAPFLQLFFFHQDLLSLQSYFYLL